MWPQRLKYFLTGPIFIEKVCWLLIIDGLKLKGWKNTYQANSNQNKAEVAIFIADKEYFRTKKMTRYK